MNAQKNIKEKFFIIIAIIIFISFFIFILKSLNTKIQQTPEIISEKDKKNILNDKGNFLNNNFIKTDLIEIKEESKKEEEILKSFEVTQEEWDKILIYFNRYFDYYYSKEKLPSLDFLQPEAKKIIQNLITLKEEFIKRNNLPEMLKTLKENEIWMISTQNEINFLQNEINNCFSQKDLLKKQKIQKEIEKEILKQEIESKKIFLNQNQNNEQIKTEVNKLQNKISKIVNEITEINIELKKLEDNYDYYRDSLKSNEQIKKSIKKMIESKNKFISLSNSVDDLKKYFIIK
ncbi:MAG: hypothetical protein Q8781_00900 [Candidatus Phytoplasma stylosanthis]|uniref:hypothetical protein n=1 Tax=Candidatus Phytoplasma stylosanthis TaxID=2798314 RepID=UPI0029395AF7|nr:hypothetical protein [Candidatus Phytoplasma stylosanthis]MDV3167877.1 hypothetical protein [Candidatus Phytoplasma stylosanthis]MDV3170847.1 hypothetical protein [Candidatus Phytoplasma stylosanthis]MDV3173527.1 hypothetical protein [Candidatus Phytoplasma stylosanthis]MDV3174027.1 hypothetical protein [Candidatus Phytoplasma stylosanthis]MDV3202461.1 hypothetical protein [Candidatus Phytoplasma stylosanthis]